MGKVPEPTHKSNNHTTRYVDVKHTEKALEITSPHIDADSKPTENLDKSSNLKQITENLNKYSQNQEPWKRNSFYNSEKKPRTQKFLDRSEFRGLLYN